VFLEQLAEVMPEGYRAVIEFGTLCVVSPNGGMAGSSATWLTADVLLEEDAVAGAATASTWCSRRSRRTPRNRGLPGRAIAIEGFLSPMGNSSEMIFTCGSARRRRRFWH